MSADLVLYATRDPEAIKAKQRLDRANWIGDFDEEDHELDEDGLIVSHALKDTEFADDRGMRWEDWEATRKKFNREPSIWIGQVSWLKAGLFEEFERYVPLPVWTVSQIVGDSVVLTPGVAKAILAAMNLPNRSIYGKPIIRRVPQADEYAAYVTTWQSRRGRRWNPTPLGNGYVLHRGDNGHLYSGVARRQHVKKWLLANMGATLLQESQ